MKTDRRRFAKITSTYPGLRIAILGDFCLDRYLEIDPGLQEVSIETGLPVYNVVNVRAQPGAAGTILNNLVALGIGEIHPIGFHGLDGEGYELKRALETKSGVVLDRFFATDLRRTFTYCKPLIVQPGKPPRELNRLDTKNWTPTPPALEDRLIDALQSAAKCVDAIIVLDQVDIPNTGVVTKRVLDALGAIVEEKPELLVIADSRRGLRGYPRVTLKMNAAELSALTGTPKSPDLDQIKNTISDLATKQQRCVFVTLAEQGIAGAAPDGSVEHVPALPIRGEIDIVGAGDAVTANLASALAGGATLREAMEIANTAASVVIHQLGTTGTASVAQISELMFNQ
ncbi:MAG: PfkB family carbohydrate kinase [Verrucomicrobiae bacterium]|nr:PfkB family carbohydrate kinase [Verrucomicrobiae bacterium]